MNPKIPCTYEDCLEEAMVFSLPQEHGYPAVYHCLRHYEGLHDTWEMSLREGSATFSLDELQSHLLKLRL